VRIAHIGNRRQVPPPLVEAQRRLGHEVVVVAVGGPTSAEAVDVRIPVHDGPLGWNLSVLRRARSLLGFDVLHVHGGMERGQILWPLLRTVADVRLAVHYYQGEDTPVVGPSYQWAADAQFHATPDLGGLLHNSQWIPEPIDIPPLPRRPENRVPQFGHFPARESTETTDRIVALFSKALGPLEQEKRGSLVVHRGREAVLVLGIGLSTREAQPLAAECDVLIDDLSPRGTYSAVAAEAMGRGTAVIGAPNLAWYPACPILPIEPEGLKSRLGDLARDSQLRHRLGNEAREYAARVHDSGAVARRVLKEYYRIRSDSPFTVDEARTYWKRRGGEYAAEFASRPGQDRYSGQVQELLDLVDGLPFASVLEVGCGFGRISRQITRHGARRWVGIDLSRDQLRAARADRSLAPRLAQASAEALPIPDGAFDFALTVEMLMHIPPQSIGKVTRELWRVARRHIVHLDWSEDYMVGEGTGWCWVHDYEALWRSLGGTVRVHRLRSIGIQCVFVVEKPAAAHG